MIGDLESSSPTLERASSPPEVGDKVYSLDVPTPGSRTIIEMDIVGKNTFGRAGERLNVTNTVSEAAGGSPLLNEYGEVVGVMGGSLLPGSGSLNSTRFNYLATSLHGVIRGGLAVPISLVSIHQTNAVRLEDLQRQGQMIRPLKPKQDITMGSLSRAILKSSGFPQAIDAKSEFSIRDDKECAVMILVRGTEKAKSTLSLRIFDAENRQIGDGTPLKASFTPGQSRIFDWRFLIGNLAPGYYRVDVNFDEEPAWRAFLRVTD